MVMYEHLFIALVGHENVEVRDEAIRLLNVIYDGVDWQYKVPHVPVIKCAGDEMEVTAIGMNESLSCVPGRAKLTASFFCSWVLYS